MFGLGTVLFVGLIYLVAPSVAPYSSEAQDYNSILVGPSSQHVFGTDNFGRDVFSRVLTGTRISLQYGIGAASLSLLVGAPLGIWCGFIGGQIDNVLMRALDVVMSIPPLMFGLLVLAVTAPAVWKTVVVIGLALAPSAARIVRSVTLAICNEEFVKAAMARGESRWYICFREILPNAFPVILVEAGLRVAAGMLIGASLSFLGLGAQPPSSDWGLMMNDGRNHLTSAPWIVLFPGAAMAFTVIGFNLISTGLRDRNQHSGRG